MKVAFGPFGGKRARGAPTLLPPPFAVAADNVDPAQGDFRGLPRPALVATLAKPVVNTIYRFGQALASATQFWFHWAGDVDVVKGAVAKDTHERTFFTGDGVPKFTTASLGTTGSDLPSAALPLGLPPPATAPTLAPVPGTGAATGDLPGGLTRRQYVYCFVNEFGDIGPPSPVAVIDCYVGQHVTLSALETVPSNLAPISGRWVFRAEAGTYLFVAEVGPTGATFVDDKASDDLGEEITSVQYDPPPADMTGLIALPNGIMAGHTDYDVYICEAYRPYAWPEDFRLAVHFKIVALAAVGQGFVALTVGAPYLFIGTDPASFSQERVNFLQPCVAKRSVVSTGAEAIYASAAGLCVVGMGAPSVLTDALFTREQWAQYNPHTIRATWHDGWYIGTWDDDGVRRGFMFSPAGSVWVDLPAFGATAFYRDTVTDSLYCAIDGDVYKWKGSTEQYSPRWLSPRVRTPYANFAVMRVVASEYPATVRVYGDGTLRDEVVVHGPEVEKLSPDNAYTWQIEVAGGVVESVQLATSPEELGPAQ